MVKSKYQDSITFVFLEKQNVLDDFSMVLSLHTFLLIAHIPTFILVVFRASMFSFFVSCKTIKNEKVLQKQSSGGVL